MATGTWDLTRSSLRELFLFSSLSDAQLDWLLGHASLTQWPAGTEVVREGDPAASFHVLLSGTLRMTKQDAGGEVELKRSGQRGAYCGAIRFFHLEEHQTYPTSVHALSDLVLLTLPADELAAQFRSWFPMSAHLLEGSYANWLTTDAIVGRRRQLLALGQLSAGLTHELNNPAAAAERATAALRRQATATQVAFVQLIEDGVGPRALRELLRQRDRLVNRLSSVPSSTALQRTDREDEIDGWLETHALEQVWEAPSIFAGAGVTTADLAEVTHSAGPSFASDALRWLAHALESELLLSEIQESISRMSALVGATQEYTHLDRTPYAWIDVHDGLRATLALLHTKIGPRIRVTELYDRRLPRIPAYPAELNQVWTNLIDNAVAAMDGAGTLTLRTTLVSDQVCVEIRDTGHGIPSENRRRVFEPFFTTRPVGEGDGLGLDTAWRIVVERHHGDLRVESEPGDTRFQVLMPTAERQPPR
ncbi:MULTISPECIES: ATP-binding protein [Amycolatopsis]|uniref:histidine kinase n=1 Tax=Amycolatopsis tucumanensis TaxID=401106 RepID=A0ABP7HNZ4_9PSEU|nr:MULTISPECIES: ATP-binding protein [Amycolatopsis]MCF6421344.1 ATP-binding protein [Amycolatopsis tucumanensis]